MGLKEEQSSSALFRLSVCCSTRKRRLLTWSLWRRFVQLACLHREKHSSVDSWLCQREYQLRIFSFGMDEILRMNIFGWGNETLRAIMLLKNLESIVALTTEGMCQFCCCLIPVIISVPRLQRVEGSCLFTILAFTGRQGRATGGKRRKKKAAEKGVCWRKCAEPQGWTLLDLLLSPLKLTIKWWCA